MANPEHLEILKQGVEVWNRWRQENPKIRPDLRQANLYNAHLPLVNLRRANLRDAYFSRAYLSSAFLTGANLRDARLSDAYLINAFLDDANLIGASLDDASLRFASLKATKLRNAVLVYADLRGANLTGAVLCKANLGSTNLQRAKLIHADLSDTSLGEADLSYADLTSAVFSRAELTGANLNNANLSTADLSKATIGWTRFDNIDLSTVNGLDAVRHDGPSTIGIDTIYKSGGNIPEVFLRGCGVPDTFITFARSLVGKAIIFYSAFISYSSKNRDFAERLYADLQNKGVRCWFAPEDIKIGDNFRQRIDEAIRIHDKLLVILSEESINSEWVEEEVESAIEREHREKRLVLFPVRIDDAVINSDQAWAALLRRMRHIGDFSQWKDHDSYRKAFARLLRDLKAEDKK